MSEYQIAPGQIPPGTPTIWLQMPRYTNSLCHGQFEYIVNNWTWQVEVPADVGHATLQHGRSGAYRIEDPTNQRT